MNGNTCGYLLNHCDLICKARDHWQMSMPGTWITWFADALNGWEGRLKLIFVISITNKFSYLVLASTPLLTSVRPLSMNHTHRYDNVHGQHVNPQIWFRLHLQIDTWRYHMTEKDICRLIYTMLLVMKTRLDTISQGDMNHEVDIIKIPTTPVTLTFTLLTWKWFVTDRHLWCICAIYEENLSNNNGRNEANMITSRSKNLTAEKILSLSAAKDQHLEPRNGQDHNFCISPE